MNKIKNLEALEALRRANLSVRGPSSLRRSRWTLKRPRHTARRSTPF
jgi:hypothetical protein